jgi:dolichol-phosphate mannosyltransferase
MDCSFSHPPKIIPKLIKNLKNSDIAIASRYVEGAEDKRSPIRVLSSFMTNFLAHILLGKVKDYTSGFVAVRRRVFDRLTIPGSKHGEYFIDFIYGAKKCRFRIEEVPYVQLPRKGGSSKFSMKDSISYLITIIKLRFGECQSTIR